MMSNPERYQLVEALARFRAASLWQYRNDDTVPFTLEYALFHQQRAQLEKLARLAGVTEREVSEALCRVWRLGTCS